MKWTSLIAATILSTFFSAASLAQAVTPNLVAPESAAANTAAAAVSAVPTVDKSDGGPPSIFDDNNRAPVKTATITAHIHVFRNVTPVDVFALHPYPVRPPKIAAKVADMPTNEKDLRAMLLSSGYQNVTNYEKPYPNGGWRWQFAFHEAIRRSGLTPPKSVFTEYQWANEIIPYVRREVKRWNAMEEERWNRYQRVCDEFDKNREEAENIAVRQGLYPVQMRKVNLGLARATVPAGSWWLTCTRKCPGLTYYWQVPISAAGGENVNVTLNDVNALVITGAW